MRRWPGLMLLATLWVLAPGAQAQSPSAPVCGVVLMHGKWGTAHSVYLQPLIQKLSAHCRVDSLEMPWSRRRLYDQPYPQALAQISAAVQAQRAAGARWVAVGGQSFGANAALAYMAQVGDADAVLALAPGHVPERFYQLPEVRPAVDEARALVQAGQPQTLVRMTDVNQGQRMEVQAPAGALWSYFDPQGWGHMGMSARQFQRAVPLLWAIGQQDPLYPSGEHSIYRQAPAHPHSLYLVVPGGHADTPAVAADDIVRWVRERVGL